MNEYFKEQNFDGEANRSGTVLYKLSLHANESCDGHAVYFWRWLKRNVMFITFLLSGSDVISLESRPLIFMYSYIPTQSIKKQIVKYAVNSKYPEEYSTVDMSRKWKPFSEEILFCVELIPSLAWISFDYFESLLLP